MFSADIVSSDAFLDMPTSTQSLYFQLGMNADDDGFVNPQKVMRMLGSSQDDLKVLTAKRFVLSFETGVVVIKHWLIHNLIRKDRYKETRYLDERSTLSIKENGAYTDGKDPLATIGQPNGNQMATQVRLGKVRLGKVNTIATKVAEVYDFKEKYQLMKSSNDKRMPIIAFYWFYKKWQFENKDQYSSAIKRELRPAGSLIGYEIKQIEISMIYCQKNYPEIWTLETVGKRIAELANKK